LVLSAQGNALETMARARQSRRPNGPTVLFLAAQERIAAMPQSLARVWVHLVFSTKDRRAYLQNADLRDEMCRMLGYHAKQAACPPACVGGWNDHVHVLCGLSRTVTIADLVETLKCETSKWAKDRAPDLRTFHWQNGYGAFSVSQSLVGRVVAYLDRQAEHHRRVTFQDEFRAICAKHEIEIDERYVWD
jgi:REP element-mobilizing transposase RayT